jgi:hypothetical protein
MFNIRKHIETFLKGESPKFTTEEEIVGAELYDEYWKRAVCHIEKIEKALSDAGYSVSPILSPDIDDYNIVHFNVRITWDRLDEVQKRIREGLPDQTIYQRVVIDDQGKIISA